MTESTIKEADILKARLHKPFDIVLRSRSVSGYEWQPRFNSAVLRLVARRHLRAKRNIFGSSEKEVFKFEPLQSGQHGIEFELVRPFEGKSVDTRTFALDVS